MRLNEFTANHMRKPWQPGRVDCLLALADWAVARGYDDPAAHLRGTYDTDDGFRAIIAAAGGVVPLVGGCASRIALKRLQAPHAGAVAVIGSATNIQRQFGAIYDGRRWLVRFVNAYEHVTARPLAIWSL